MSTHVRAKAVSICVYLWFISFVVYSGKTRRMRLMPSLMLLIELA